MSSVKISSMLMRSITSLDEMIDKLDELENKQEKAKELRESNRISRDLPLERQKDAYLKRISKARQEVILNFQDEDSMQRALIVLLDSMKEVYQAASVKDLEIPVVNIESIETNLKNIRDDKKKRKSVRLWAVIVSIVGAFAIGVYIWLADYRGISNASTVKIINLPVPVILWSVVGSVAAILYRFTNAGDSELREPLRWLVARPLSGIIMGAVTYLIIKVGLITINADNAANTLNNSEVMYLIAFLAGFSDRFSDYLLRTMIGQFGGNSEGDLLTLEVSSKKESIKSNRLGLFKSFGKQIKPSALNNEESASKMYASQNKSVVSIDPHEVNNLHVDKEKEFAVTSPLGEEITTKTENTLKVVTDTKVDAKTK